MIKDIVIALGGKIIDNAQSAGKDDEDLLNNGQNNNGQQQEQTTGGALAGAIPIIAIGLIGGLVYMATKKGIKGK